LTNLSLVSPVQFAEDYYVHYPKVTIGHWPPVFYLQQALWSLLFSTTRSSILILMAILAGLIALTIFHTLRNELGTPISLAASLLWLMLPLAQQYTAMVMAEIPLTLLCLWAVLCFARYLQSEHWRSAVAFGILASLAILTKGNGFALAAVPPLALAFTRKWHLLRRPCFWSTGLVIVLLCGPWYWVTRNMLQSTWRQPLPTIAFALEAVRYYAWHLVTVPGWVLFPLALLGLYAKLFRPLRRAAVTGLWASVTAFLIGTLMLSCAAPAGIEERFLIPAMPAVLMFAGAGIAWSAAVPYWAKVTPARRAPVLVGVVIVLFLVVSFHVPRKAMWGYVDAAQMLLSNPELHSPVVLIASDATGEGMFIVAVANGEKRPGHFVLRSSKVLCDSDWLGTHYEALYRTPQEMQAYLESIPVGVVVMDDSVPEENRLPHQQILDDMIQTFSERWRFLGNRSVTRRGVDFPGALRMYQLVKAANPGTGEIKIPVSLINKILGPKK
jgi:4-amino-4-deoxy-L-arabinose transferase-like glycosyltransferase